MRVLDPIRPGRTSCRGTSTICAVLLAVIRPALPSHRPRNRRRIEFTPGRASIEGPVGPFLVPLDRGYYKNESLNVTIDEPPTVFEPITRVASGTYDMALRPTSTRSSGSATRTRSAPVRAIFMVYNRPPFSIIGRKSRGVSDPKSLEGKRLGAPPSDHDHPQWPVFAKLNDIDASAR